uniref:Transcription factor S-II n=1 Tax=Marseillevirus LCMAC201 TaxID=2506605 RepID=A0A481YX34_9VIRU|nr:MAG: transcription factor S-II [Marseillevirus LCMAC201]
MNVTDLYALFKATTKLKFSQIKELTNILLKYEETNDLAYEVIGHLNTGITYTQVKKDVLAECFGWKGSSYREYREERAFRDNILAKPPEVREGEFECSKCHLFKTLVVEMQTRSADEGFTYYIHCFNPKCKAVTKSK